MYLQQTDNTRVRKSGKIAPFHPHVRGLHHGIHPNFLQTSPGLSSLAVLHAPCAVARHTSGNAPTPPTPTPPPRKRPKAPQPFAGLRHQPLCTACAQATDSRPKTPGAPPPLITYTRSEE